MTLPLTGEGGKRTVDALGDLEEPVGWLAVEELAEECHAAAPRSGTRGVLPPGAPSCRQRHGSPSWHQCHARHNARGLARREGKEIAECRCLPACARGGGLAAWRTSLLGPAARICSLPGPFSSSSCAKGDGERFLPVLF